MSSTPCVIKPRLRPVPDWLDMIFLLPHQIVAARDPRISAGSLQPRSGNSTLGESDATCLKVA
jgi:hypothetical protein